MEIGYPIVQGVLGGFSGTIFAYGQTGSGKTFTMEGPDHHDEVMKGMIPRMFQCLFQLIEEADEQIEFTVKVSFLEIYMEKIMDLLNPKKSNLVVRKDKVNGVFVKDATEVYVNNADEMLDVMQAGSQNRSIAATRMNARSSRSHSLFMCTVFQKDTKNDSTKLGKLYCIDLAGSEKTEKTNATGQTLEEAKMINKSLSALGNVINALTDTKKNKHIPYRDSKLTQILQESIGGNSLTCLIITCSLSAYNDRETLSTLRFGNRAKSIKNKPIANAQRSAKELLGELNKTNKKIEKLDEIIRSMQKELKSYFDSDLSEEEIEEIKKSLQSIACAKDIDVIYAMLKPDLDIETLEENKEDEEDGDTNVDETRDDTLSTSKVVTTDSEVKKDQTQDLNQDEEKTSEQNSNIHIQKIDPEDPTQKALIQENAMKVVKQHIEITKLKEEIEQVKKEKEELEEEISSRSIEIYEMNEKILLMEMNHANDRQDDLKTIQDLKSALEYNQKSSKLVYDFSKFKDSLERLKDDLEVLKLSDKFTQNQHKKHFEVTEEFLGDNLDKSGKEENLEDSNNSSKNLSSDKLVLDNIQKMIELINLIQDEIEEQSKNKGNYIRQNSHKKRGENETGNSTTIMQDIDIITRAVSENVEANDQDSFLNSM